MSTTDATTLLILAIGVFLAPPLSARIGIPAAVGEMLYGAVVVLLAPWLKHGPGWVNFVQHFGFLFVLFLAGLELNTRRLLEGGPRRLLRALPFGVAVPVGAMLGARLFGQPPVIGLIAGTISIGLSTRLLADMGLLRTPMGQVAVATGAIGEVVTIISITVLTDAAGGFSALGLATTFLRVALLFGAGAAAFLLLRDLAWWRPAWFSRLFVSEDTSEFGMRSAFALLAGFAAAATLLSVPDVLAAFVAGQTLGVLFPLRETQGAAPAESLRLKLRAAGFSFFVPIGFITVGQHLDFSVLLQRGPLMLGLALTLASGLTRFAAMPLLRLQTDWNEAVLVAIVLCESLTMKVTVAQIAVTTHVLPAATLTPAIAATSAADIIFPVLFRILMKRRQRAEAAETQSPLALRSSANAA